MTDPTPPLIQKANLHFPVWGSVVVAVVLFSLGWTAPVVEQDQDRIAAEGSNLVIQPIRHAMFVLGFGDTTIEVGKFQSWCATTWSLRFGCGTGM